MHFFRASTNGATFEPIPRERVPEGGTANVNEFGKARRHRGPFFLAIGAMLSIGTVKAEDVTEDQILRALAPEKKPLTRSLSMGPPMQTDPAATEAEGKFLQSLRNRSTRSLSVGEREQIATMVKGKPKIDLEINFDYNSDRISAKSLPSVQALGRALANPDLKGSTFIVAGHTDAAGGDTYNQDLSERRADSIKRYLVEKSGISAADLVTVGYGKTQLKDPANPLADSESPRPGRQHGKQGHASK